MTGNFYEINGDVISTRITRSSPAELKKTRRLPPGGEPTLPAGNPILPGALERNLVRALAEIGRLAVVRGKPVFVRIEDRL